MYEFENTNGHVQLVIPLQTAPLYTPTPTITGGLFSEEAGTVLYGHYTMEYRLPGGDKLRLIANHNKKSVQIMLLTHDANILKLLPGERASSLVAETIRRLYHYVIRSNNYTRPLSFEQEEKLALVNQSILSLNALLPQERSLQSDDFQGQEELRKKVLAILDECDHGNRLVAIKPTVSEGTLGYILYDAYQTALHFHFNRVYAVSSQDQMDFSEVKNNTSSDKPMFIWDSETHVAHQTDELDNALSVICQHYDLTPTKELIDKPASRFAKLNTFFYNLYRDARDWISYLSAEQNPQPVVEVEHHSTGLTITKITPYYVLRGLHQEGYATLSDLMSKLTLAKISPMECQSMDEGIKVLNSSANGSWANIPSTNTVLFRLNNQLHQLKYFAQNELFYPLPSGDDLYTLSQLSKRHLYFPERFNLKLKAFLSKIPTFFKYFYRSLWNFVVNQLIKDFFNHIHSGHEEKNKPAPISPSKSLLLRKGSVREILEKKGILANGQTLEEFIVEQMRNHPYVIARANHPPSPVAYDNPLHRVLSVTRHIGAFFVDSCERNPLVGTLAVAAYFFGAGAIIAPKALESLLIKLYLNGLISAIEPAQWLGRWMSHGTLSEAISSSVTLWQGVVAGGNLDSFFIAAVNLVKDDPAEVAIIATLAMSLGYGLTKLIPALSHEMGEFPYTNYAALGGKGGAAIYDTIMHPGDDWLLGSCKWISRFALNIGKIVVAPFIEGARYGFQKGFLNGWKKSYALALRLTKQMLAASADLLLAIATIPLLEVSAMLIHVPFKGLTNLVTKVLGVLGDLTSIGILIRQFSLREGNGDYISSFTLMPFYGFTNPFGQFFPNRPILNLLTNGIRLLVIPPLECVKNFIVLPLIDFLTLTGRVLLSVIDPVSRGIAFWLGSILYYFGKVWDNNAGFLFTAMATGFLVVSNWIDKHAGILKQYVLSAIQVKRHQLYHWAFSEDDALIHHTLTDFQYFHEHPSRIEKIPHKETNAECLYHVLLAQATEAFEANTTIEEPKITNVFSKKSAEDNAPLAVAARL